ERVDAHERARALAVEVEVAAMELVARELEVRAVLREHGAREPELAVVRELERVLERVGAREGEHRGEDLLLEDPRLARHVGDDRRPNIKTALRALHAARDEPALFLADF